MSGPTITRRWIHAIGGLADVSARLPQMAQDFRKWPIGEVSSRRGMSPVTEVMR
jgi:hypothetical protein